MSWGATKVVGRVARASVSITTSGILEVLCSSCVSPQKEYGIVVFGGTRLGEVVGLENENSSSSRVTMQQS